MIARLFNLKMIKLKKKEKVLPPFGEKLFVAAQSNPMPLFNNII